MTDVTHGVELTFDTESPTFHWFATLQEREDRIAAISSAMRKNFDTREVKAVRVANLDGVVYAEHGPAAVHEKWRLTEFAASHRKHYVRARHVAFVDLIGGKVLICDSENPFETSIYTEWPKETTLEESYMAAHGVKLFSPKVRPALEGEPCHYRVVSPDDIALLSKSEPRLFSSYLMRAGMDAAKAKELGAR